MGSRKWLTFAAGVCVAVLASGTAVAAANAFGTHQADRVGSFTPTEHTLVPATGAPPRTIAPAPAGHSRQGDD